MIVISAGMPRSGTGWIYNLTNDLLVASGQPSAHDVRLRYHLTRVLREHNCSVGQPNALKLMALTWPHLCGRRFAVKTHAPPTASLRAWVVLKLAKVTYSYRDPRDVVVSAYEEGQRMRSRGVTKAFAEYEDISATIDAVRGWLSVWDQWMAYQPALHVRYEDVKADTLGHARRIAAYLDLQIGVEAMQRIVVKYAPGNQCVGAHFSKGESGRFREVLSRAQIDQCHEKFGAYLAKMGYA